MQDNLELLEEHGFNTKIFLFGEMNLFPISWPAFITKNTKGFVGQLNFTLSPFRGTLAFIPTSELSETKKASFPAGLSYYLGEHFKSLKENIYFTIEGLKEASNSLSMTECSFIGDKIHLDFMRHNHFAYKIGKDILSDINYYEPFPKLSLDRRIGQDDINISFNNFGTKTYNTNKFLVSISDESNFLFVSYDEIFHKPYFFSVNNNQIDILTKNKKVMLSVSYKNFPKLTYEITGGHYFLVVQDNNIIEKYKLTKLN